MIGVREQSCFANPAGPGPAEDTGRFPAPVDRGEDHLSFGRSAGGLWDAGAVRDTKDDRRTGVRSQNERKKCIISIQQYVNVLKP